MFVILFSTCQSISEHVIFFFHNKNIFLLHIYFESYFFKNLGIMLHQLIVSSKREHKPKITELVSTHRDFVRLCRAGYQQRRALAQRGFVPTVGSIILDGESSKEDIICFLKKFSIKFFVSERCILIFTKKKMSEKVPLKCDFSTKQRV